MVCLMLMPEVVACFSSFSLKQPDLLIPILFFQASLRRQTSWCYYEVYCVVKNMKNYL